MTIIAEVNRYCLAVKSFQDHPAMTITSHLPQALPASSSASSLSSRMVLAGLPSVSQPIQVSSDHPLALATKAKMGEEVNVFSVTATKPMHEVGASRLLSFAKPAAVVPAAAEPKKASVWTLEDMDDDTVELVDDTTLLEEEDMVKVDPSTLRYAFKKKKDFFENFFPTWGGGVFPISKTFVSLTVALKKNFKHTLNKPKFST